MIKIIDSANFFLNMKRVIILYYNMIKMKKIYQIFINYLEIKINKLKIKNFQTIMLVFIHLKRKNK